MHSGDVYSEVGEEFTISISLDTQGLTINGN
jgi:hypothetical protein